MKEIHPTLALAATSIPLKLTPLQAHGLSFLISSGYVGSIYFSNLFTRLESPSKSRAPDNEPSKLTSKNDSKFRYTSLLRLIKLRQFSQNWLKVDQPAIQPISSTDTNSTPQADRNVPKPGDRDHPQTIKRRMKAVSIATLSSLGSVYLVIKHLSPKGQSLRALVRFKISRLSYTLVVLVIQWWLIYHVLAEKYIKVNRIIHANLKSNIGDLTLSARTHHLIWTIICNVPRWRSPLSRIMQRWSNR